MNKRGFGYGLLVLAVSAVLYLGANFSATDCFVKADSANVKAVENVEDAAEFYGKDWRLVKIEGKATETDKAFIKFDQKSDSMGGNGGCNYIGAKFAKNANDLKFTDISTTVMACQQGLADEYSFLKILERVNSYKLENGRLFLMENENVVLEFEEK